MDISILKKAGLAENQAKAYLALIEHGQLSPMQLGQHISESRENAYAIANKLVSLGLASRTDERKIAYKANHPSALEALAERRRKIVTRNEIEIKQSIAPLMDMFYALSEEPGARTLQGQDGLKEVFNDILRTGKDVYYLRAPEEYPTVPVDFFNNYKKERLKLGINTYAFTPLSQSARKSVIAGDDKINNIHNTFYPREIYTQPVEIDTYGDKVAFLAFGETQMATIITSPLIAAAVREIFIILQMSFKNYSDKIKQDLIGEFE